MDQNMTEVPNHEEIQNESILYPVQAQELALAIKDDESYRTAGEFLITIKGFRKKVEETFGPVVKKAHDAWKGITELRKQADAPLDEAERIIKPALALYDQDQDRKRRAEQDRLMAEQKKLDEDGKIAQATNIAKNGDLKAASAILNTPPAPVVRPAIPKATVAGISYSEIWRAECINLRELVMAISQGKASISLIEPNITAINAQARALKAEFKAPGIRTWSERIVSGRSK